MKDHVVWSPIMVCVSDVMDCTDSHCNLANCIDNGQVDDSPIKEGDKLVTDQSNV